VRTKHQKLTLSRFDKIVVRLKEDNPQLTVREILLRIDKMNETKPKSVLWPKSWANLGHRLLTDLFDDDRFQGRIKTYISKLPIPRTNS
jgi:hypothetical protein